MTTGEKIRFIRTFRGMTQKALGEALELKGDCQARIAQYEMGFRTPKRDVLEKMAQVLDVCIYALDTAPEGFFTQLIELLFWADTEDPHLMSLSTAYPDGKPYNSIQEFKIEYCDNDSWLLHDPTMLWFQNTFMDDYLKEWEVRKRELREKTITLEEYTEWKLQWPYSCDCCGKCKAPKQWRAKLKDTKKESS